eukprot:6572304-Pyramimonas_sp.AAC.1
MACTATFVTEVTVERQRVRNLHRREPVFTCSGEAEALTAMLKKESQPTRPSNEYEQRCCSEWLATATRHNPWHNDGLSHGFTGAVISGDELDSWAFFSDQLANWPPEGCENHSKKHLGVVEQCL